MEAVNLDPVIHALYDAALAPEQWERALELLGDALGGCAIGASIQRSYGLAGSLAQSRLDPHFFSTMLKQFPDVRGNEMVAVMAGLPAAVAVARQSVKSDESYFRSSLYNEIFAPQGLAHAAVVCAFRSSDTFVPLGIFNQKNKEFGQREYAVLKVVLPHLERAINIGMRIGLLETRRAGNDEILNRLPFGVILLESDGSVREMNDAAQTIVAAQDGLSVRQGKLHAACLTDHAALQDMIASALRVTHGGYTDQGAALPISRPSMAQPLLLIAMPSPGPDRLPLLARHGVVVFVIDPDQRTSPSQALLMRLFDLTPTESKLASRLAEGTALGDAALQLGMRADTARKHVKNIFRKTGAGRQSDLVRLVINSAAVLERAPKPPQDKR